MKTDIGSTLSRRSLALGFASVLAFRAVPAFAGAKRHAGKSAAEEFLGSIYQRYLGKSSAAGSWIRLAEARSVRSYFTPGLASLILEGDRKSTRLNSSHIQKSRMPSSA